MAFAKNPALEHNAKVLASVFEGRKPGDVIGYDELSAALGADVRHTENRSALTKARKILRDEHNVVVRAVKNVGLRILSDSEKVRVCPAEAVARAMRATNRARREVKTIDAKNLTDDDRNVLNAAGTQLAVVHAAASSKMAKRIADNANGAKLSVEKAMRLFGGGSTE